MIINSREWWVKLNDVLEIELDIKRAETLKEELDYCQVRLESEENLSVVVFSPHMPAWITVWSEVFRYKRISEISSIYNLSTLKKIYECE